MSSKRKLDGKWMMSGSVLTKDKQRRYSYPVEFVLTEEDHYSGYFSDGWLDVRLIEKELLICQHLDGDQMNICHATYHSMLQHYSGIWMRNDGSVHGVFTMKRIT
ncbi:hypothetical protein BLNAU_7798 [Blattamonas nauphoetae]|uniref:Uncharacterized protein n=1 Tax=Blattamonas nauphoetae TaxID=2049346 RepID=A0ABQ9Y0I7_9EUKA|nr:hypothetical protein BLNAU_7798 [Blattamonas nauphoetae]